MGEKISYQKLEEVVCSLKKSVESFEKSNKFFDMLINSLPGLFYLFDEDYNIIMWNRNVEKITMFSYDEIKGKDIFSVFGIDNKKKIKKAIEEIFSDGSGITEASIITKNNRCIPHFFSAVSATISGVSYLLGIALNTSEYVRVESELQESEKLYRLLAQRLTEGLILLSDNKILFVNDYTASMLGYDDSEKMLGSNLFRFVNDEFEIYFKKIFRDFEDGLYGDKIFKAKWNTFNNEDIWVEGRANRIIWKNNPSVLLTVRDVTEAKLKEKEMQDEAAKLRRENVNLKSSVMYRYRFGNIIGKSDAMQKVYDLVLKASTFNANVIIYGESGTGKELVARAVHEMSNRHEHKFISVNCAAIPDNLLESEFFGHKKGAFTGAVADKQGYLDHADKGMLFLDEVGELQLGLQAKLLRAIEGGGYIPVGGGFLKKSNFRVVCATNRNLKELIKNKKMREDFYYRIHILPVYLPPLRDRKEDIPLLAEHFMHIYSPKNIIKMTGSSIDILVNYNWPGNIRELQNVIQRYLVEKNLDFLVSDTIYSKTSESGTNGDIIDSLVLQKNVEKLEFKIINQALNRFDGNKSKAAKALKISRKTLDRKIDRLDLFKENEKRG